MPTVLTGPTLAVRPPAVRFAGWSLALAFAALATGAAALAGCFPIGLSITVVFLFAGPHNWFEARYLLGRLPARTGKLWPFFAASVVGVLTLTGGFAALPWLYQLSPAGSNGSEWVAGWSTLLVLWITTLTWMRSRTAPRFDAGWVWAVAAAVIAAAWAWPSVLPALLVFAHPLMALWLLDRELARSRRSWRPPYWAALALIPVLLGVLCWQLHDAPELDGDDPLTVAIRAHAGERVFDRLSTHFLVAAHTFLETVHYGVWVVLVPLVGLRSAPWQTHAIPAARRGPVWTRGVKVLLLFGLFVCGVLWLAFAVDYPTTRRVYFTVAMLHVLAEVPFLLRML